MNINESNRLIASFLGYKFGYYETYEEHGDELNYNWVLVQRPIMYKDESELIDHLETDFRERNYYKKHYKGYNDQLDYYTHYLKYFSEWENLMESVDLIEELDYGFKICRKVVEIYVDSTKHVIFTFKEKSKKDSLYKAIVEFIIWNKNL